MINSTNYCLKTNWQAKQCPGCENCCQPIKETKAIEILSMIGLYAEEAHAYYLYSQSWFRFEDQNNKQLNTMT